MVSHHVALKQDETSWYWSLKANNSDPIDTIYHGMTSV